MKTNSEKVRIKSFSGYRDRDMVIKIKYGKQYFFKIDFVDMLSKELGISKSEVKRVIFSGGMDLYIPVGPVGVSDTPKKEKDGNNNRLQAAS